jgi:hypothetical protein
MPQVLKRIVRREQAKSAFSKDASEPDNVWPVCFGVNAAKLLQCTACALARATQWNVCYRNGGFSLRITSLLFAAAVAAAVLPSSAFAQSPRCEALRLVCENKDFIGARGMGTCREYRESCLRPLSYEETCRQLRYQCHHKEELGLEGEGTCRRFHETCH